MANLRTLVNPWPIAALSPVETPCDLYGGCLFQAAPPVSEGQQTIDFPVPEYPVPEYDEKRLDCEFDRLQRRLPGPISRSLRWLRDPSARWVRWPVAILFILGGLVGFLPVLGFWMVPVGLMLLAQDVPFLRPPLLRAVVWVRHRWAAAKGRWRKS